MNPEIASDKQSIVDVLCKDSHGNRYIAEMQLAKDKSFEKRAQLYAAKAYSRQSGNYIDFKKLEEEDLAAYEERVLSVQKEEAIWEQRLDDARDEGKQEGRQEGIQIGHEKGRAEGKEEGIQIGAERGREEGEKQAKIAVAKNSLKAGVSIDVIAQITVFPLMKFKS
ncbi:transposase [Trichonephila clavata]|uniref:Transposase n=1 Tax=Trichonephila clavata TaxID=2740835 RepID=A0A8X6HK18_TRICU|nr:transposase [Trichonephila clavata]